jgi:hypothetical protein
MKYVLYFVWFLLLPLYLLGYVKAATEDAMIDLKDISKAKYTKPTDTTNED